MDSSTIVIYEDELLRITCRKSTFSELGRLDIFQFELSNKKDLIGNKIWSQVGFRDAILAIIEDNKLNNNFNLIHSELDAELFSQMIDKFAKILTILKKTYFFKEETLETTRIHEE